MPDQLSAHLSALLRHGFLVEFAPCAADPVYHTIKLIVTARHASREEDAPALRVSVYGFYGGEQLLDAVARLRAAAEILSSLQ